MLRVVVYAECVSSVHIEGRSRKSSSIQIPSAGSWLLEVASLCEGVYMAATQLASLNICQPPFLLVAKFRGRRVASSESR